MPDEIRELSTRPTVNVKTHEAYDLNVTVEFLPTRKIPQTRVAHCQPRQGAERVRRDPLDLPEETRDWLVSINDAVIAWLARDERNRKAFIADPVRALGDIGVEMDRTHLKALARARETIGMGEAAAPGLQLRSVRATAKKTGRVKPVDTATSAWSPPKLREDEDAAAEDGCGCKHEEKEGK